jgi:anti-sigma factor RsiW
MARSRLIAWMDGELEDAESSLVKEHVDACTDCLEQLRRLRVLSREITGYCAAVGGEERRRYWIPAAAAAAVVLAAGILWMTRTQPEKIQVVTRLTSPPAVLVTRTAESAPVPLKSVPVRRRNPPRPAKAIMARGEPGVTVVIALDEVLPFGAAPPGAVLVGNLTFDAGGQPSKIQLQ